MEKYWKGENIEEVEEEKLPFNVELKNVKWFTVKPSSKMSNLIEAALKSLSEGCEEHVWSGSGPGIVKTISCVEIMKSRHKDFHQITKIVYHRCEELWIPKQEGLDQLKVIRNIPAIYVLLSKKPLDPIDTGYQAPKFHTSTKKGTTEHCTKGTGKQSNSIS